MAAGEYLKSAASSLRRAAAHLDQQAKEMQAHLTRVKSEKSALINKNTVEIKTRQAEQMGATDSGRQSYLSVQIQKLQAEIMAAEQELKQAEADVQTAVSAKINSSQAIESQAKQLESQAGSID